jgi:hypothetical protein
LFDVKFIRGAGEKNLNRFFPLDDHIDRQKQFVVCDLK